MSLRFEARLAADRYSTYLDANTRGAPIAQSKAGKTRAVIGNVTDVILGSAAVALADNPTARTAIGALYLVRGTAAAVGVLFAGFEIRLTGAGGSSRDPEVVDFNRSHRVVSAVTSFAVGASLIAGFAGREAAMFSASSGAIDLVASPLLERLTRPTKDSIGELVSVLVAPKSERHARVAASDLKVLRESALPALANGLASATTDEARGRVLEVMRSICYWSGSSQEDIKAGATAIATVAARLIRLGSSQTELGLTLLGMMNDTLTKNIPAEVVKDLEAREAAHAARAADYPGERGIVSTRDAVGQAVARAAGRRYASAESLTDGFRAAIGTPSFEAAKAALLERGLEAVGPLSHRLDLATAAHAAAANAAYVLERLDTMPVKQAFEGMPHELDPAAHTSKSLLAMRDSGNLDLTVLRELAPGVDAKAREVVAYTDAMENIAFVADAREAMARYEREAEIHAASRSS